MDLKTNISGINKLKTSYKILSVAAFLLLLHSCLYETNQLSTISVQKPSANHPLNLTLSENKDSLLVFGETTFQYNVNTFGLNFTGIEVKFNGQKYQLDKSSGKLWVTPDYYNTTDWLDLTINFYASTGSGSIADKFKAENYVGTKTWKVKYIDIYKHDFSLHQRISPDSILQIYYVNPHNVDTLFGELTKFPFTKMKVTSHKGDTLFFADSVYCGGSDSYRLEVTKHIYMTRYYDLYVNHEAFSVLIVTDINKDSCLVSWSSIPFKVDYKVTDSYVSGNYKTYYTGSGHSFKDTQPNPGWGKFYFLNGRSRFNKSESAWGLYMDVYWKDHTMQ